MTREENGNICFFDNVQTVKDLEAVNTSAWLHFFNAVLDMGMFDYIVVDFSTELSHSVLEILSLCKKIIVPVLDERVSMLKIESLFRNLDRMELNRITQQIIVVLNKYHQSAGKSFFVHSELGIKAWLPYENLHVFERDYNMSNAFLNELVKIKDMI